MLEGATTGGFGVTGAIRGALGWPIREPPANDAVDLVSPDGTLAVEVKTGNLGARDLHAGLVQLAMYLARTPTVERAVLVLDLARMSPTRVAAEWKQVIEILRTALTGRIALVARAGDTWVVLPRRDATLDRLVEAAKVAFGPRSKVRASRSGWTAPRLEVWKTLLDAWLLGEAPLQLQTLASRAGCSAATVNDTLAMLETLGETHRASNRSVGFTRFPRRSLAEVVATARHLRDVARFIDGSGRSTEPSAIIKRLRKLAPPDVALGGVAAARVYDNDFDLNGLPRIDVTVGKDAPADWVRRLDPALLPLAPGDDGAPLLVVHRSLRPLPPTQDARVGSGMRLASPADTLLDLLDLGLTEQAQALADDLRKKAGGHV